MRCCECSQSLLLLLAVITAVPCPSLAAESGEQEYRCALPAHCRTLSLRRKHQPRPLRPCSFRQDSGSSSQDASSGCWAPISMIPIAFPLEQAGVQRGARVAGPGVESVLHWRAETGSAPHPLASSVSSGLTDCSQAETLVLMYNSENEHGLSPN